jgi:hypothetical protein
MGINNPVAIELENLQTLRKLGENSGRLTFNGAIVGGSGGSQEGASLSINTLDYAWNAEPGYFYKLDTLEFPLFAVVFQIISNFVVRVRLYQSEQAQQQDLGRPPQVKPTCTNQGIILDCLLGGSIEKINLIQPIIIISPVFVTIERVALNSGIVNLTFNFVG